MYDTKHKKHPLSLRSVGTKSQTLTLTQPSPYQTLHPSPTASANPCAPHQTRLLLKHTELAQTSGPLHTPFQIVCPPPAAPFIFCVLLSSKRSLWILDTSS